MANMDHDPDGWSLERAWDELGRIRQAIEESIPRRLIGTGHGAEATLEDEVLALAEAVRLMGAHVPDQLEEATLIGLGAWAADASDAISAPIGPAEPSPGRTSL